MRFYLNEASVQGQFDDEETFRPLLEQLLAARARSPVLAMMRTTPALAERPVSHARSLRQVVQSWRGSPAAGAVLAWVGKQGPFIEDDRLVEADDLFHCLGADVTEGGLGEAARRTKAGELAASVSFPGGARDFAQTPLSVTHGFEDEPIANYPIENFWDANAAVDAALAHEVPAGNWREMVEAARRRYPRLLLPDALYHHQSLAREPFEAIIRDRFYVLLSHLDAYMSGRNDDGSEGVNAKEIIRTHFQGDQALFSPESWTNRNVYENAMTFVDPEGGGPIFAHWHGKIRHRSYRLHFEWPVPAEAKLLKILYVGPKLTKS